LHRVSVARFALFFVLAGPAWLVSALAGTAWGKPTTMVDEAPSCGAPPPATSTWFYLGDPGPRVAAESATAAHRVYQAVMAAFDDVLSHDPACLHVEVLDPDALRSRSRDLDGRHGAISENVVGFHQTKLGADSTVYVMPKPGQGIEVVMLHEVLHALSHRFSIEASRRRINKLTEGATEYLTRELASVSFGIPKPRFQTGYGPYLRFYTVLIDALGREGMPLLGQAYLIEGYDYFEREVDRRLGISLREAGHLLESGDVQGALQQIKAR
jgi:hypothetical protein